MYNEKMWEEILNKSNIRYLKEIDGELITMIIATNIGSHKYQFFKGKCISSNECKENFDEMLKVFTWAFTVCPQCKLEIYGGEPVCFY